MEVEVKSSVVGTFRVVVAHFEAGDTMAVHRHMHRGHLSLVIGGELVSHTTDHGDVHLGDGDTVFWPIGTEHSWEAITPATLINVFHT